jgi:hypothetical protein
MRLAAAGAVPTTTTSRSEGPRLRYGWRAAAVVLLAVLSAVACRRGRTEPAAAEQATPALRASVPAPAGLLMRGALRRPAEVWHRLRELAGGRALLVPSSFPLAVTTLLGFSPLTAGIVDETAAVAVAVIDAGASGVAPVLGVRLTSGSELLVALANGADARFVATPDPEHEVTLLSPRAGDATIGLAVSGDYLIVARSKEHVRVGGAYVARTLAPSLGEGPVFELVAPAAALRGPLSNALRASVTELREAWKIADVTSRARHGGRAPDYADPEVVMAAVGARLDAVLAVLGTAGDARCTATLLDPAPLVRVELAADRAGAARDLVTELVTSDLQPLTSLPAWTQAAVVWRRSPDGAEPSSSLVEPLRSLVGERLSKKDVTRLQIFATDAARGLGGVVAVGAFDTTAGLGMFAVGPEGNGDALRRATARLADVVKLPAFAEPLESYFGRFELSAAEASSSGLGRTAVVRARSLPARGSAGAREVASASVGSRAAVVVAPGAAARLEELLKGARAPTLGADPVVARAVVHAGSQAAFAAVLRAEDAAGQVGWSVLTLGSDRRVAWAELGLAPVSIGVLLSAWLGG